MKYNETTGRYTPGIIYELRCKIGDEWHPFYVGETVNPAQRLAQHRNSAAGATGDSTLVYTFIKGVLDRNDIEWDMFEVERYGQQGPTDREDEHIMRLLLDGVKLKNMKKGNTEWMAGRLLEAEDMRQRGITSYRKYREVLDLEQKEAAAAEKHAKWLAENASGDQTRASSLPDKWAQDAEVLEQRVERRLKEIKKLAREQKRAAELAVVREQQRVEWERTGKILGQE